MTLAFVAEEGAFGFERRTDLLRFGFIDQASDGLPLVLQTLSAFCVNPLLDVDCKQLISHSIP